MIGMFTLNYYYYFYIKTSLANKLPVLMQILLSGTGISLKQTYFSKKYISLNSIIYSPQPYKKIQTQTHPQRIPWRR